MPKPKKTSKQDARKSLPATSKTFCVELAPDLIESLRKRGRPESKIIGDAINTAASSWGFPHKHAGVGLRHLRKNLYECRSGLKTRLLFLAYRERFIF
jgi:hypothetical protein